MRKRIAVVILSLLLLFLVAASTGGCFRSTNKLSKDRKKEQGQVSEKWEEEEVVIPGKYCDADVVKLDGGRLRIYYSPEPEVPNFEGQIYSAVSTDGLNWTQDGVTMLRWATFPSVIKLSDGRWRMYFQGNIPGNPPQTGILSAVSLDGLNWTQEDGFRVRPGQQGQYDTENVASPTVIRLSNGTYLMVYRGSAGENRFGKLDPMNNKPAPIDYLMSATSSDGLNWTSQSVVVDSRNEKMRDQIDGPELVLDGDTIKLYCNSYEGVYVLTLSSNGKAVSSPRLILRALGPEHAPSDVTVIKINGAWRMYYGIHTKGIFTARRVE